MRTAHLSLPFLLIAVAACDGAVPAANAQARPRAENAPRGADLAVSVRTPKVIPLVTRWSSWRVGPTATATSETDAAARSPRWFDPQFDDTYWTWSRPVLRPSRGGGHDGGAPASSATVGHYRKRFIVNDPKAFAAISLRLHRGAGAIVWMNGREIARDPDLPSSRPATPATPSSSSSRPAAAAAPSHGDTASTRPRTPPSQPGGSNPYSAVVCLGPDLLREGENVIAVELRRRTTDAGDVALELEVLASDQPAVVRGPYLQMGTSSSAVVRFRTDCPARGVVAVGRRSGAPEKVIDENDARTEHELRVGDLRPDTVYTYAIGVATEGKPAWLAGGDEGYAFRTAPTKGKPLRIWVLGDSGTRDDRAAAVRDAYAAYGSARPTDVWLMLGDNAYNRGLDHEYQAAVFDMYPDFLRSTFLWPAVGNHETSQKHDLKSVEASPHFALFTLPTKGETGGLASGTERYFSFDWGDVHFVCLDSMTTSAERDRLKRSFPEGMLSWLKEDLAANRKPWTIAFFHHPPYTKGTHDSDLPGDYESALVRRQLNPILESHGVDLVLSGHSHVYERSFLMAGHVGPSQTFAPAMKRSEGDGRPAGTGAFVKGKEPAAVYIVAGSSGGAGGGKLKLDHPAMLVSFSRLGSLVLDVDDERLDVKFLRENGFVDDHFTMVKGDGARNPPARVRLSSPAEGATFAPGATLELAATVDEGRAIARVDFYRNPRVLLASDRTPPFTAEASSLPAGDHQITAVAVERGGREVMALPVTVRVTGPATTASVP